jgi:cell division septation protein DedD
MTETDFQRDLFEGEYYEKKARKPVLLRRYSEQRFLPQIKVPVEYAVIIAIGLLVLIIISHALGVERGRRLAKAAPAPLVTEVPVPATVESAGVAREAAEEKPAEPLRTERKEDVRADKKEEEKAAPAITETPADAGSVYVIQLASFKNLYAAEREAEKIRDKGIRAELSKSGEWYQVFASGFRTIDEARDAKRKLSADYKDCFIRRVK